MSFLLLTTMANILDGENMERENISKTSTTLTRKGVMMMKRGRQLGACSVC